MRAHSTPARSAKPSAKAPCAVASEASYQPDDQCTVKFATPRKSKQTERMTSEELDGEKTISFSRQPSKSLLSKQQTPLKGAPRKEPNSGTSSAHQRLTFSSEALVDKPVAPKTELWRSHKHLLEVMKRVDSYLLFLKIHRAKSNDLFSSIQNNLNGNYGMLLGMDSIRKILFLLPKAYNCTRDRGNISDIRLSLPPDSSDLDKRASQLRKAIEQFVAEQLQTRKAEGSSALASGQDEQVDIPSATFDIMSLGSHIHAAKRPAPVDTSTLESEARSEEQSTASRFFKKRTPQPCSTEGEVLNPYSILEAGKRQEFRQKLLAIVREKQSRINKEKQLLASEAAAAKATGLTARDYEYFVESLTLLYVQRHVNNMFLATAIEQMSKKINYSASDVSRMVEQLQRKGAGYLKILKTIRGDILQMDKSKSSGAAALVSGGGS